MSDHTPEPWAIGPTGYDDEEFPETSITALDGTAGVAVTIHFAHFPQWREGNARRIVACVNACAGISTEALERSPHLVTAGICTATTLRAEIARLTAQRDELLVALQYAVSQVPELATVPGIACATATAAGEPLPHATFLPVDAPDWKAQRDVLLCVAERVCEEFENFERMGEVCAFEGNSMVYASTLEDLADTARAAIESATKEPT